MYYDTKNSCAKTYADGTAYGAAYGAATAIGELYAEYRAGPWEREMCGAYAE